MEFLTLYWIEAIYLIVAVLTGLWTIPRAWDKAEDPIPQGVAAIMIGTLWFIFLPWLGLSKVLKYRRKKNENA